MQILGHWLIGVFVAFLAAAPLGPVNLAIVQAALNKGRNAAWRIALGSSFIEMLYCLLAVWGTTFLFGSEAIREQVMLWLKVGSIPILFTLGAMDIGKTIPRPQFKYGRHWMGERMSGQRGEFWLGLSLNLFNPVLLPLWIGISSYLRAQEWLSGGELLLGTYALGAGCGTFLIMSVITWITLQRNQQMRYRTRVYLSRGIGFLFFGFGIYQCFEVLHFLIERLVGELMSVAVSLAA